MSLRSFISLLFDKRLIAAFIFTEIGNMADINNNELKFGRISNGFDRTSDEIMVTISYSFDFYPENLFVSNVREGTRGRLAFHSER